jgi:hemerythrin superfamily protein
MDAIELLKRDHDHVRELLDELSKTTKRSVKKRHELLEKIHEELMIHTTIEEEIFYPAFRDADGTEHKEMFYEAQEEHRAVEKLVLPDLEDTDVGADEFAGRVKVLKELIEHHAEEEEKEMFPRARKSFSKDKLKQLGEQLAERKQALQAE